MNKPSPFPKVDLLDPEALSILLDFQRSRQCNRDNNYERDVLNGAITTLRLARLRGVLDDRLGNECKALKAYLVPHLQPVVDSTIAEINGRVTRTRHGY